ncbi:MAG: hypothetical protein ACFFCW_32930 [Candidatus Hodarchaeota archaeon]
MANYIFPDDIVIAILHHVKTGDRSFTADREKLHRTFFRLKNSDPKSMKVLGFRDRGMFPESTELDQAFSNLEATGLLQRQNENPRCYFIQKELDGAYQDFVSKRIKSVGIKNTQVKKLAEDFIAECS